MGLIVVRIIHITAQSVARKQAQTRKGTKYKPRGTYDYSASAWAVFRFIQLPKMRRVLTIAILLRFMDSFMIYTEPFVLTGGGPGNTTTFLSIDLVKIALGQFDLGPAAAMSLIYFMAVLLICWAFYTIMMRHEEQ